MPNIASLLKSEITRVARKELRAEVAGMKKALAASRSEIAALKRRAADLEKQLRALARASKKAAPSAAADVPPKATRFSAKGLAAQRKRLGLSANDCGRLLGASGQSVYNWEEGKAYPRAKHLAAIAALRALGKREVTARLAALADGSDDDGASQA